MTASAPDVDLAELATVISARLPRGSGPHGRDRARRYLSRGQLETAAYGTVADVRRTWMDAAQRSRGRYLHGFLFLPDFRSFFDAEPDATDARAAVIQLLRDWEAAFPPGEDSSSMAYHDETTAQRLIHVASILSSLRQADPDHALWLLGFLDRTAEILFSDEFHAGDNNHGMFQDIALLTYAGVAEWRDPQTRRLYFEKANERLLTYFRRSFTSEGVHVENAPNYHILVARYLKQHRDLLARLRPVEAAPLSKLLEGANEYATHAVLPSGSYPLISDTQPTHLPSVARDIFKDPGFLYAATAGKDGTPPAKRVLTLPESGYAIYRSSWGESEATYVMFQAAYNSGYHKHSDDNSLWITSGGRDLLAEAGPNGYEYTDPLTQYAYSQFAHNTIIAGERSTPRHDGRMDDVRMDVHETRHDGFRATGHNGRLDGAVHERTVDIREDASGAPTIVVDDHVRSERRQHFQMLWNVGEGLAVRTHHAGFDVVSGERLLLTLRFSSESKIRVSVHVGERSPTHLGWRFPKFGVPRPSPVVRLRFSGVDAVIRTTIAVHDGQTSATKGSAPHDGSALVAGLSRGAGGGAVDARMKVEGAAQYAFKLFRGSDVVAEVAYSRLPHARWEGLGPGRYRVRGYARRGVGEPLKAETSASMHLR